MTSFTKNRGRLLNAEIAEAFFCAIRSQAEAHKLLSREHFSVDGTLIEEGYGWMKDVGGLRKLRHRGTAKVAALFAFTCAAYDLVRLRSLLAEPSSA